MFAHSLVSLESVGRPSSGIYTKLDNTDEHGEGEICMGGRHIFMGYLNAPEKTEETKDKNGWLHSGDLGKFDSNGNLFITGKYLFYIYYTRHYMIYLLKIIVCCVSKYVMYIFFYVFAGRIKELIITSGGENVAPINIEHAILSELSYLSNVVVIGDKRKYLIALVTLKVRDARGQRYKYKNLNF